MISHSRGKHVAFPSCSDRGTLRQDEEWQSRGPQPILCSYHWKGGTPAKLERQKKKKKGKRLNQQDRETQITIYTFHWRCSKDVAHGIVLQSWSHTHTQKVITHAHIEPFPENLWTWKWNRKVTTRSWWIINYLHISWSDFIQGFPNTWASIWLLKVGLSGKTAPHTLQAKLSDRDCWIIRPQTFACRSILL